MCCLFFILIDFLFWLTLVFCLCFLFIDSRLVRFYEQRERETKIKMGRSIMRFRKYEDLLHHRFKRGGKMGLCGWFLIRHLLKTQMFSALHPYLMMLRGYCEWCLSLFFDMLTLPLYVLPNTRARNRLVGNFLFVFFFFFFFLSFFCRLTTGYRPSNLSFPLSSAIYCVYPCRIESALLCPNVYTLLFHSLPLCPDYADKIFFADRLMLSTLDNIAPTLFTRLHHK